MEREIVRGERERLVEEKEERENREETNRAVEGKRVTTEKTVKDTKEERGTIQ